MKKLLLAGLLVGLMVSGASALTVTSGDIYALDPAAQDYGAVRFKDFINAGDGGRGGNLYLQDTHLNLGSGTGRVQGDPLWTVGSANSFKFEYRSVVGGTDLILAGATDRMLNSGGTDLRFSRSINDPLLSVNFLSFYIQSNEGTPPTIDTITLSLLDLDGNTIFSPGTLSFSSTAQGGGNASWYLTDSSLLANGFILQGSIGLSGTLERTESDKVQIAFGHSKLGTSVPDGGATVALLGIALAGVAGLRRKLSL